MNGLRSAIKGTKGPIAIALVLASITWSGVPNGVIVFGMNSSLKGTGTLYFQKLPNGSRKKLTSVDGRVPEISPDGRHVVFSSGDGGVYICELKENAHAVRIASGHEPHFWFDPRSGDVWVTYSSLAFKDKQRFGNGKTHKIRVDLAELKAVGSQQEITFGSKSSHVKGGMSHSGTYMCTAYPDAVVVEVATGKTTSVSSDQRCWPSIAPGPELEGYMMMEKGDHNSFWIGGPGKTTKQFKPNSVSPTTGSGCQSVRWSSHPEWMSYSNAEMDGGKAVIVRFKTGGAISEKHIVSTEKCYHIYLWVDDGTHAQSRGDRHSLAVRRNPSHAMHGRVLLPNGALVSTFSTTRGGAPAQDGRCASGLYVVQTSRGGMTNIGARVLMLE